MGLSAGPAGGALAFAGAAQRGVRGAGHRRELRSLGRVARTGCAKRSKRLRAADCLGANVTAPHKQAAVALMDEVSDEVRALGAVNTIVNAGRATDRRQHRRARPGALMRDGRHRSRRAARAWFWALAARRAPRSGRWATLGASSVLVLNRTPERAAAAGHDACSRISRTRRWTCAGRSWHRRPNRATERWARDRQRHVARAITAAHLTSTLAATVHRRVALELAYNPPETGFMVAARAAGARAENGLGMLVHQAALAFERWTGQTAARRLSCEARAPTERVTS